jgi:hypothetical protein
MRGINLQDAARLTAMKLNMMDAGHEGPAVLMLSVDSGERLLGKENLMVPLLFGDYSG